MKIEYTSLEVKEVIEFNELIYVNDYLKLINEFKNIGFNESILLKSSKKLNDIEKLGVINLIKDILDNCKYQISFYSLVEDNNNFYLKGQFNEGGISVNYTSPININLKKKLSKYNYYIEIIKSDLNTKSLFR